MGDEIEIYGEIDAAAAMIKAAILLWRRAAVRAAKEYNTGRALTPQRLVTWREAVLAPNSPIVELTSTLLGWEPKYTYEMLLRSLGKYRDAYEGVCKVVRKECKDCL